MKAETTVGPKGRMAVGVVFMTVGLVLTLSQAGVLNIEGIGRWWPLFLIGIGIVKVRQPLGDGQRAMGVALLFVGGLFQLMSVLAWGNAWPLLMILAGAFLLWQAVTRPPMTSPPDPLATSNSSLLSELALMGGVKKSVRVPDFRGGYITVVMGGVELDLRKSTMGASPAYLDVVALLGGIELKIPPEWTVEGGILPFMGGFENKCQTLADSNTAPRLVLRGYAVMGGVSVGN